MRYPNETWSEIANEAANSVEQWESMIINNNASNLSGIYTSLYHGYKTISINQLVNKEITKFKNSAFNAASTAMYTYEEFKSSWYVAQIYPFGLALLSDHAELIEKFITIEFTSTNKWIKTSYLLEVQRALLNNNNEIVKETIKYIDHKISLKKNVNLLKANKLCISGIFENNVEKLIEGINIFEKPTQKNSLARNEQCETVFSMFPSIYLKIAEMKGIEVEFENNRVIKDAILINPLSVYELRINQLKRL